MSKIIVNKVLRCADGCGVNIYYQDTGSTHLNYEGVDKTENGYRDKCGSELIGEDLGNFHIDFSMDKANTETCAVENLFLGKGTYTDMLEPTGKYGKPATPKHVGMKCIPTPCIKYHAEQHGLTVLDVYTK